MIRVITPGHKYQLTHFDDPNACQTIQFIEKSANNTQGILKTLNDGTTNEAVLEMLIDRLHFLGEKLPSRENAIAITKLEEALMWLNKRTQNRKARGVEGTHLP